MRLRRASYFLFAWPKRKITKEKGHPAWRLPGILPGKSVSRGRAFRQHIRVLAKRSRHPVDSRYAACRPRLTAAQGPRVEQRAIVARTFQKRQSKAGAARWTLPFPFNFLCPCFRPLLIPFVSNRAYPPPKPPTHALSPTPFPTGSCGRALFARLSPHGLRERAERRDRH